MATPIVRRALLWILRALLTIGFLVPGLTKLAPQSGWVERFASWGYGAWFVTVVGLLETLGAMGLWVPRLRQYAVALLAIIMFGAAYTNLTHPPITSALRPIVFLVLLAGLAWSQRASSN